MGSVVFFGTRKSHSHIHVLYVVIHDRTDIPTCPISPGKWFLKG